MRNVTQTNPSWRRWMMAPVALLLLLLTACGGAAATPVVVEKEVIKEVPVEVVVEKDVIKEVPVEVVVEKVVVATSTPAAPPTAVKPVGTLNMGFPETGKFEAHPKLTSPPRISITSLSVGEGIFSIREDLSAGPLLAESWSVSDDFLTWTFNMRKGVQFHKGYGEMTAEDFVYSQNQFAEGAKHARSTFIGDFWNHPDGSVEFPDAYTVKVNTGVPWVDGRVFEWMANQGGTNTWVVSKKQSEELGVEAASRDIAATGPWEIVEERSDEFWRMLAVEDHWRQTPHFAELVFWTIPEESSRVAGFQTDNLDTFQMEFDSIPTVEQVPGARLMSVPNAGQAGLNLYGQTYTRVGTPDQSPSYDPELAWVSGNPDPASEEWDKARKVRLAMAISIDRGAIVDNLLRGFGRPLVMRDWAGHEARMPDRWQWEFNPDRARQLLAEAGYPDGFSITLTPAIRSAPAEVEACQAVSQMWRDVGIDVKEQNVPYATLRPSFIARTYQGATCHSVAIRLVVSVGAGNYHDSSTFSYGTHHPRLDELITAASSEMDPGERVQREIEIYDFMYDNVMAFGLYSFDAVWPVGPKIEEWQPDGFGDLRKVSGFQFIRPRR